MPRTPYGVIETKKKQYTNIHLLYNHLQGISYSQVRLKDIFPLLKFRHDRHDLIFASRFIPSINRKLSEFTRVEFWLYQEPFLRCSLKRKKGEDPWVLSLDITSFILLSWLLFFCQGEKDGSYIQLQYPAVNG